MICCISGPSIDNSLPPLKEPEPPTFTDLVIDTGVALALFQRWRNHVSQEIDRRVELIDAERA